MKAVHKEAKNSSTRPGLIRRGGETIIADLGVDGADAECPPCEVVSGIKTLWDIGSWAFGGDYETAKAQTPPDDDPPPQPSACAVNENQMPLDMEPPETPDDDEGSCKVSCEDYKISFSSNDMTNTDGSFQGITVSDLKYTGTVLFKCSGEGKKDYKL